VLGLTQMVGARSFKRSARGNQLPSLPWCDRGVLAYLVGLYFNYSAVSMSHVAAPTHPIVFGVAVSATKHRIVAIHACFYPLPDEMTAALAMPYGRRTMRWHSVA
jgi:hypothetical protein